MRNISRVQNALKHYFRKIGLDERRTYVIKRSRYESDVLDEFSHLQPTMLFVRGSQLWTVIDSRSLDLAKVFMVLDHHGMHDTHFKAG